MILWYLYDVPNEDAVRIEKLEIEKLEAVGRGFERVITARRQDLKAAYAVPDWQRRQTFGAFDQEGMRAFLESF